MSKSNNAFVNFFTGTPSYNDDKDYAAYAFYSAPLNMFFLASVLLHGIYLVAFSTQGIIDLTIVEILCVLMYTTFVVLLRKFKGSWLPCTLLTAVELFAHTSWCLSIFGLSYGFQYLLIPLLFMSVFIRKHGTVFVVLRRFIILVASASFIFFTLWYKDLQPGYTFPKLFPELMLIANCIVSFIITAAFTSRVIHSLDEKRSQLDTSVNEKMDEIEKMQNQIIISFANIIEARDGSTGKHVKRTSEYVEALVKELRRSGEFTEILDDKYMHDVMMSAPLHDIGKITVPDAILQKAGRLTQSEFDAIKRHTINGKAIIEESMSDIENEQFLKVAKNVAVYHHECWDGSGYPYGIKGDEIPLEARIMTIADYFDALVAKRAYKAALPTSVVFDNIKEQRGKKFDPVVVDAFLRIRETIDEIAKANAD